MDFRSRAGSAVSAEIFAQAFESWPEAVAFLEAAADPKEPFRILYVNAAFERLYRTSRENATGQSTLAFWRSRSARADQALVEARMREGKPFKNNRLMEFSDGSSVWLEVSFSPLEATSANRWMLIARDVTATHDLHRRMSQLTSAVDKATDVVAIYVWNDGQWKIDYINEAFTRTLGYDRQSVIGSSSDHFVAYDADMPALSRNRQLLREGQTVRDAVRMRHKNGTIVEMEYTGRPLFDPQTESYNSTVIVYRDVTEVLRRERSLLHAAEHDALTGLYNRRFCEAHLEMCVTQSRNGTADHALLFVDLDGFKSVNDRLGHHAGDDVLISAAEVFKSCVLGSDVVARWGGDEFAIVLHHCTLENAQAVARRMIADLAARTARSGVGASIGILSLRHASDVTTALENVDSACYNAKHGGGNRALVFDRPATEPS